MNPLLSVSISSKAAFRLSLLRTTALSIAALTDASSLISHCMAKHYPPALTMSSEAVNIVPSNLGCGVTVLAAMTMFAPSFAALNAIAKPIPLEAPLIKIVFPFKLPAFLN